MRFVARCFFEWDHLNEMFFDSPMHAFVEWAFFVREMSEYTEEEMLKTGIRSEYSEGALAICKDHQRGHLAYELYMYMMETCYPHRPKRWETSYDEFCIYFEFDAYEFERLPREWARL